ncbi:MAG: hypothetical protein LUH22_09025 [Bacteroides sp.]|nr:hypothetical protein [Bacteroides sp.]
MKKVNRILRFISIFFLFITPLSAQTIEEINSADRIDAYIQQEKNSFYFTINNSFSFSGNDGSVDYSNPQWSFQGEWKLGYNDRKGYEAEARAGRILGITGLYTYVGIDWTYRKGSAGDKNLFGQRTKRDRFLAGTLGVRYKLPLSIIADARIDTYKHARLQLEANKIELSNSLLLKLMANTDKEYEIKLSYLVLQDLAVFVNYDSDLKVGAGISIIY